MKERRLSPRSIRRFQETVYRHYRTNPRNLPWRKTRDPYRILVSEIMLQQTQVERVIEKYKTFITAFPNFASLRRASLQEVLRVWQGMGYNRRAVALKKIAEIVTKEYGSALPSSEQDLLKLPGIGKYSAPAVLAFAFGKPTACLETNIRRVFLHFFFPGREHVKDSEILPLIEQSLDRADPRKWYYALMDYGVTLKKKGENPNRRSAHYRRQSVFQGSNRQLRGRILRLLVSTPGISESRMVEILGSDPEAISTNLDAMVNEGFLRQRGRKLAISP